MARDQRAKGKPARTPSGFLAGFVTGVVLVLVCVIALNLAAHRVPERLPGSVRWFFGVQAEKPGEVEVAGSTLTFEQLQAIRGVRPRVQVTLTEDDINAYIADHPESLGLPKGFAVPIVRFENGLVQVSVRTKVLLWPVRVNVAMQPHVADGELTLSVVEVKAGRVSLPGEFRQQIEKQVAGLLSQRLTDAGLEPEGVTVGEGTLTVSARLVPVAATGATAASAP